MNQHDASTRVYVDGSRPDVRVPMREVALSPAAGNGSPDSPVRLYDTSGLHGDSSVEVDVRRGLPEAPARLDPERDDVEEYDAEPRVPGRGPGAQRRRELSRRSAPAAAGEARATVTQLHYARRGEITPEMEFAALRENLSPEFRSR